MNKKGFTLIELITTIALLAIISLISFVSINKVIENNKINNCNNLEQNIKNAVKEYVSDNRYDKEFVDEINDYQKEINASVLTSNNYLKGEIINPYSKETINPSDIAIRIFFNRDYTLLAAVITGPEALLNDCNISDDTSGIPPIEDDPANNDDNDDDDLLPPFPEKPTLNNSSEGRCVDGSFEVTATVSHGGVAYWQYSYQSNNTWVTECTVGGLNNQGSSCTESTYTAVYSTARDEDSYIRACYANGMCGEPAATHICINAVDYGPSTEYGSACWVTPIKHPCNGTTVSATCEQGRIVKYLNSCSSNPKPDYYYLEKCSANCTYTCEGKTRSYTKYETLRSIPC